MESSKMEIDPYVYCHIQQGGSSREFYLHTFDTREEADAGAEECNEASYNVSRVFTVPRALADTDGFAIAVQEAIDHAMDI